ncbi:MAG: hypothetical protein AAF331_04070 [Pseudomonadota bacterium]
MSASTPEADTVSASGRSPPKSQESGGTAKRIFEDVLEGNR